MDIRYKKSARGQGGRGARGIKSPLLSCSPAPLLSVSSTTVRQRLHVCLLIALIGCTPASPQLSDAQFADLFAEVFELHRRYPHAPDSLVSEREMVFKRYGIIEADIERFIQDRQEHPEKWDPLLALLRERFGETTEVKMKAFQKTAYSDSTKKTGQQ